MNKLLLLLCMVMCSQLTHAQTKHVINYPDGKRHIEYLTKNGLLNGTFTSYYENGLKKAEGGYTDNQRKGLWTVWDAKGNKRMERFFENSMESKIISVWDSSGIKREVKPISTLKYSTIDPALGYIPYYPIKEENVLWEKRLWRAINNDSSVNSPLFDQNRFYYLLINAIKDKEIDIYADDEFVYPLTYDSIKKYENIKITSYLLKEDIFFNKPLNIAEYRTIGICPVMKKSGKMKQLFWLYYPEIRSFLAKSAVEPNINNNITNYESIFFKRYFHSTIYKESNLYGKEIRDYKKKKDIYKEAERIEMNAIDYEFDCWYRYIVFREK